MKKVFTVILVLALVLASMLTPAATLADGNTTVQDIGYINYSVDGKTWTKSPELIGDYGHRVWFTCATALFPAAPYNYEYTSTDWEEIEDTWISVRILVPEGTVSRIWAYAWKQNGKTYSGGYLMELDPGYYEFAIKNGEIQNWPEDESFAAVDLNRIFDQARDGNVNVENALAFSGVTANLEDRVPNDLTYSKVIDGPASSFKPAD